MQRLPERVDDHYSLALAVLFAAMAPDYVSPYDPPADAAPESGEPVPMAPDAPAGSAPAEPE